MPRDAENCFPEVLPAESPNSCFSSKKSKCHRLDKVRIEASNCLLRVVKIDMTFTRPLRIKMSRCGTQKILNLNSNQKNILQIRIRRDSIYKLIRNSAKNVPYRTWKLLKSTDAGVPCSGWCFLLDMSEFDSSSSNWSGKSITSVGRWKTILISWAIFFLLSLPN